MDPTKDQTDQPTTVPNNQDVASSVSPPVGGPSKEVESVSQDLISPFEKGPEVSAELKEIGTEKIPQAPQLVQEETVETRVSQGSVEPVTTSPSVSFKSPLTQTEMAVAKKSPITDAIAWLARTIRRQIERSKFKERESLPKPI